MAFLIGYATRDEVNAMNHAGYEVVLRERIHVGSTVLRPRGDDLVCIVQLDTELSDLLASKGTTLPTMTGDEGCPRCHNTECEGGFIEVDGNNAIQEMTCLICGYDYSEYYRLYRQEEGHR